MAPGKVQSKAKSQHRRESRGQLGQRPPEESWLPRLDDPDQTLASQAAFSPAPGEPRLCLGTHEGVRGQGLSLLGLSHSRHPTPTPGRVGHSLIASPGFLRGQTGQSSIDKTVTQSTGKEGGLFKGSKRRTGVGPLVQRLHWP